MSDQVVTSGSVSQKRHASPMAIRSSGSKLSSKRSRTTASSPSETSTAAPVQPERPVLAKNAKKIKSRKALLDTLWSAEELIPLKAKTEQLYDQLNQLYVDPPCPLDYSTPFQLLVAVTLSAQVQAKPFCLADLLPQGALCQIHCCFVDHRQEGQPSHTSAVQASTSRSCYGQYGGINLRQVLSDPLEHVLPVQNSANITMHACVTSFSKDSGNLYANIHEDLAFSNPT